VNAPLAPRGRLARQLLGGGAAIVAAQLLLLQQADAGGRIAAAFSGGLALCVIFGLVAFVAWMVTGVHWPLVAWALAMLVVAIDQNLQPQLGSRDAFGAFADGATVPAPLLSAHGDPLRPREDRLSRNGD
jgi:hypothetical protein